MLKIIGRAVGMKPDNVLDKFWPRMTAERITKINLIMTECRKGLSWLRS